MITLLLLITIVILAVQLHKAKAQHASEIDYYIDMYCDAGEEIREISAQLADACDDIKFHKSISKALTDELTAQGQAFDPFVGLITCDVDKLERIVQINQPDFEGPEVVTYNDETLDEVIAECTSDSVAQIEMNLKNKDSLLHHDLGNCLLEAEAVKPNEAVEYAIELLQTKRGGTVEPAHYDLVYAYTFELLGVLLGIGDLE